MTPFEWTVILVLIAIFAGGLYLDATNRDKNGPRPL